VSQESFVFNPVASFQHLLHLLSLLLGYQHALVRAYHKKYVGTAFYN